MSRKPTKQQTNPLPRYDSDTPPALVRPPFQTRAQRAEWEAKNARAKAIILQTLEPGSEPWKIAEPLEYAADIWKALKDKYGPKTEQESEAHARWNDGEIGGVDREIAQDLEEGEEDDYDEEEEKLVKQEDDISPQIDSAGNQQPPTHENSNTRRRKTAEETEQELAMRDQRFLWALLNGGKEYKFDRYAAGNDMATI